MIHEYQIVHSERVKGLDLAYDLGPQEIVAAYSSYGAAFQHFFRSQGGFHASLAVTVEADGLYIAVNTDLDELSVRGIINAFLADANNASPRLALRVKQE